MEKTLLEYNPWWYEKYNSETITRHKYLNKIIKNIDSKKIIVITGLRRVGKTTLIKQIIAELLKKKNNKKIFYASLDNFELGKYSIKEIIEKYRQINKISIEQKAYIFLDEITYKDNFQQELKNIYDMTNINLIISSSSTSVLKDKRAFLTGRTKTFEIMPLDFKEFLEFKKINVKRYDYALMKTYFDDYMKTGGMPEYVLTGDIDCLKELVENIVYKDIIAFHNIKESSIVFDLLRLLAERAGKRMTYNKLSKLLGVSTDTIRRYLSYFEETYLIYIINRHGTFNEQITSPKKIYFSDTGIRNILTGFKDSGNLFENIVFLRIKNKKPLYYIKDSIELDFVFDKTILECKYTDKKNIQQEELSKSLFKKYNIQMIDFEKFLKYEFNEWI